jgi:hypothetical protein
MTPTTLLSYLSCKKHEGARASSTLLEGFDPIEHSVGGIDTSQSVMQCEENHSLTVTCIIKGVGEVE